MPLSTKTKPARPRAILYCLLTCLPLLGIPPAEAKNPLIMRRANLNAVTSLTGAPKFHFNLARFDLHGETEISLSALWNPSPKAKDADSFIGSEWRLPLFNSYIETHSPTSITLYGPAGTIVPLEDKQGSGKYTQRKTDRWAEKIEGLEGGYLYHTHEGIEFRYEDSQLRSITLPASDGLKGETFDLTYATPLQPGALTRRSDEVDVLTYTLQTSNEEGILSKLNWEEHELAFYVADGEETFRGYRPVDTGSQLVKIELDGQKLMDVSYQQTDGTAEGLIAPPDGLYRVDFDVDQEVNYKHGVARRIFLPERTVIERFQVAFHPITEQVYWVNGDPFFFNKTKQITQTVRVKPDGTMTYWENRWNKQKRSWEVLRMATDGTATLHFNTRNEIETMKGCRVDLDAENRTFEFIPGEEITQ